MKRTCNLLKACPFILVQKRIRSGPWLSAFRPAARAPSANKNNAPPATEPAASNPFPVTVPKTVFLPFSPTLFFPVKSVQTRIISVRCFFKPSTELPAENQLTMPINSALFRTSIFTSGNVCKAGPASLECRIMALNIAPYTQSHRANLSAAN